MPGGTKCAERSETSSEKSNLERSRTEKRRQNIPHDDPTAQLFSDKIPDKEKVCSLGHYLHIPRIGFFGNKISLQHNCVAFD